MKVKDWIIYFMGLPDDEKELELIQDNGEGSYFTPSVAEVIESGSTDMDTYDERIKVDGLYYTNTKFIVLN